MTLVTSKNDRMFKTIIANEKNHDLMNAIFSEVMGFEVTFIAYLKNELPIRKEKERGKTLDVIVMGSGVYYNLELNTEKDVALHIRNLNFFTSFYSQHTIRGKKYDTKTKFVHIDLSYNLADKIPLRTSYKLRSEDGNWEYVQNFEIIEVNMDKLKQLWYSGDKEVEEKYKHLLMLDIENIKDLEKLSKGDKLVKEYTDKLVKLNMDKPFIRSITPEEDAILIENTIKEVIFEEGVEEGLKKGIKQKAIETAKTLLTMPNITMEQIAEATKLSIEEINNIM